LFRRSNYFQFLEDPQKIDKKRKWKYPLPEFGGVYSPKVLREAISSPLTFSAHDVSMLTGLAAGDGIQGVRGPGLRVHASAGDL
jgi:hypothetical protein